MKINLYYAPFPSQIFRGCNEPINTERPLNPKSALPTLATGLRMFSDSMGFDCDIEIIDMQLGASASTTRLSSTAPTRWTASASARRSRTLSKR